MSRGINKVILVGHLGADPDYRQSPSGTGVARCSLATNRIWNDDQGQKQQKTEWHRIVFFNRLAEISSQYLKKGMQVYVEGELRTSSWEKDGVQRYSTDIIVREMQMLGGRASETMTDDMSAQARTQVYGEDAQSGSQQQSGGDSKPKPKETGQTNKFDDLDDDIPF